MIRGEPESPLPPDSIHQGGPADAIRQDDPGSMPISLPALTNKLRRLRAFETQFDETLERAKLDAMAEFAAGAGHEINNPVAVIAGRAQLFLRTETDPKRRHDLALMDAQARRVYEMIADMRLFARPPEPQMRGFDLARLVADTLDELRGEADRRSIGLRQTGKSHLSLTADPDQIAVALRALCKNAFESIQKNGTVEVRLEENGPPSDPARDRRRSRYPRRRPPSYLRPLLLRPTSRPRPGLGPFEGLADCGKQPRRDDRSGEDGGRKDGV